LENMIENEQDVDLLFGAEAFACVRLPPRPGRVRPKITSVEDGT
jgi:hypothetical protein